jgi:hypothetical protein
MFARSQSIKCLQACQFETPQLRRGRRARSAGCLRFPDPAFRRQWPESESKRDVRLDSFLRRLIYSKL